MEIRRFDLRFQFLFACFFDTMKAQQRKFLEKAVRGVMVRVRRL